jgi:putative ABC transport system permease protein
MNELRRFLFGIREGVRIALEALAANPFRSGLTILGIAIGVSVVVLMAALITGIRGSVQEGIESSGPRNFYVTRFDPSQIQLMGGGDQSWLRRPPVTSEEARRVATLPFVDEAVVRFGMSDPAGEGGITLRWQGRQISGVSGTGEGLGWPRYQGATFVEGRNFTEAELDAGALVVALSTSVADDLFEGANAVGERVQLRAGGVGFLPVTVVGVFTLGERLFEEGSGHTAVIPHTTGERRFKISPEGFDMIVVPAPRPPLDAVEDQVIGALRSLRGLAPGEENNFSILRSTQILEIFDRFTAVFFIVMLALSSVGLLVGGVGVVGIMMISVTERTREIGIRKALGATQGEILWQFLVEAAVLTFFGGASGLLLGGGLALLAAKLTPIPASIPLWSVAASLGVAVITGMLFGLIPALRAARMEPVAALRYE